MAINGGVIMSGGSSQQTQQLDPAFRDAFLGNVESAKATAAGLAPRQFAGFNQDQTAGANLYRQFADPNSEVFTGMRSAFDVAGQAANYRPQNVTTQNYGGATVAPAAMAAQQGYTAERAQAAQLAREAVRDVEAERIAAERVSGKDVTTDALSQIAPQARANIRDIEAASFLNQNIQKYMDPYTQAVTQQGLQDLDRSRQLQQQRNAGQATASKAFGGSRQGVVEAETNRAFDENAARYVAQQNSAAFQAAQQASEADLARTMEAQRLNQAQDAATTQQALALSGQFGLANQQSALEASRANQATGLQAGIANQGMDFNVGQLNTMNQQAVNLANAAAGNQASQFGASAFNQAGMANQAALNAAAAQQAGLTQQAGLANSQQFLQANLANQQAGLTQNQQRLGAAGQMANIAQGGQQMGFAGAQNLANIGNVQQQFSQQQLDAIRNLPLEQQQIINQALGLNVGGGSGAQSSSTSRQGILGAIGI